MSELIQVSRGDCPEFFDYNPNSLAGRYKVHREGNHFCGVRVGMPKKGYNHSGKRVRTEKDKMVDEVILRSIQEKVPQRKKTAYIMDAMIVEYGDEPDLLEYVEKHLKYRLNVIHNRLKRFKRKLRLNVWNYFCTFTYSDDKLTEDEFRKKLRKCLSNLAVRHGWRYMGVWERGLETNRLHFHALMFIPNGNMVGKIIQVMDYDTRSGRMQRTYQNTFFNKRFGRSDFEAIDTEDDSVDAAGYILKYITKDDNKIIYSRGIPSEIEIDLADDDIAIVADQYYFAKYILYDNVVDWEKDVYNYKNKGEWKQLTFFDRPIEATL